MTVDGRIERSRRAVHGVSETHTAVAGERAFKLKKPGDLGFEDFTSLRDRETARVRETELNRRLAPDAYLGVGELRDPAGQVATTWCQCAGFRPAGSCRRR